MTYKAYDEREMKQKRIALLAEDLKGAFVWSKSKMGFSFWNLIHAMLIEEMER